VLAKSSAIAPVYLHAVLNRRHERVVSILGISAFYHDSAACLVVDGEIVAAAQEERFNARQTRSQFSCQRRLAYCLSEASLSAENLDYVGFYDKPLLNSTVCSKPISITRRRL